MWPKIDWPIAVLNARIGGSIATNGLKDAVVVLEMHITLNTVARDVLARQVGKHAERVFTFHGKPLGSANTKAWKAALKRSGIENFRRHDLRHTWASWLMQGGHPLHVLQETEAGCVRRQ